MWKNLKYDDVKPLYEINEFGEIRNKYTNKKLKPHLDKDGYYQVALARESYKKSPIKIHRLVARNFIVVRRKDRPQVNHKNGIKTDNLFTNLEWISGIDNSKHAAENNLYEVCENRYNAKFTNNQVHKICKLFEDGYYYYDILNIMQLDKTYLEVLKKIRQRKNYVRISKNYKW